MASAEEGAAGNVIEDLSLLPIARVPPVHREANDERWAGSPRGQNGFPTLD